MQLEKLRKELEIKNREKEEQARIQFEADRARERKEREKLQQELAKFQVAQKEQEETLKRMEAEKERERKQFEEATRRLQQEAEAERERLRKEAAAETERLRGEATQKLEAARLDWERKQQVRADSRYRERPPRIPYSLPSRLCVNRLEWQTYDYLCSKHASQAAVEQAKKHALLKQFVTQHEVQSGDLELGGNPVSVTARSSHCRRGSGGRASWCSATESSLRCWPGSTPSSRQVDSGGFGSVWKANSKFRRCDVAVKRICDADDDRWDVLKKDVMKEVRWGGKKALSRAVSPGAGPASGHDSSCLPNLLNQVSCSSPEQVYVATNFAGNHQNIVRVFGMCTKQATTVRRSEPRERELCFALSSLAHSSSCTHRSSLLFPLPGCPRYATGPLHRHGVAPPRVPLHVAQQREEQAACPQPVHRVPHPRSGRDRALVSPLPGRHPRRHQE